MGHSGSMKQIQGLSSTSSTSLCSMKPLQEIDVSVCFFGFLFVFLVFCLFFFSF
jgi:hypothetical protein